MKRQHCNELKLKAIDIHERAESLKKQLPMHLKLMPEIKQTLTLINDISEVLLCLTQMQNTEATNGTNKGESAYGNNG